MIKNYIKAARLRTLPLSISGIIIGSVLGNEVYYQNFNTSFCDIGCPNGMWD